VDAPPIQRNGITRRRTCERFVNVALIAVGIFSACSLSHLAQPQTSQQQPAARSARIKAFSLVPKEEVKKHLPWIPALDRMPIEEEPVGTSGSSCNYSTVFIQVLPFSQARIDLMRKKSGIETAVPLGVARSIFSVKLQLGAKQHNASIQSIPPSECLTAASADTPPRLSALILKD